MTDAQNKIKFRWRQLPPVERLADLFCYDDGRLLWRIPPVKRIKVGDEAGYVNREGYISVCIDGVYYGAHRIVWKLHTGQDPVDIVDHIDGARSNNKISNLRCVSHAENMRNKRFSQRPLVNRVDANYSKKVHRKGK